MSHELGPADGGGPLDQAGHAGKQVFGEILLAGAGLGHSRNADPGDRDPEGLAVPDAEDAGLAAGVLAVQEVPADQGIHDRAPVAQSELQAGLRPGQREGEQGRGVAGHDEVHVVRAGGRLVKDQQITQDGVTDDDRGGQAAAGERGTGHRWYPKRPALGG
jgi:hypothetical protein